MWPQTAVLSDEKRVAGWLLDLDTAGSGRRIEATAAIPFAEAKIMAVKNAETFESTRNGDKRAPNRATLLAKLNPVVRDVVG